MKPQPSRLLLGGLCALLPLAWLLPMPVALADGGTTFVVSVTVDGVDALPGDGLCATAQGECTLRAAVMEANTLPSDDRIVLGPNFYYLSIAGSDEEGAATGDLDVYGSLTIVGQGMMATAIHAGGAATGDRGLHIHPGAMFTLDGVSVTNADIGAGANGAGLRNDGGTVVVKYSSFQFNQAHNGAGLMNVGSMLIEHSLIGSNTATDAGAGVRNDGTLEIDGSSIYMNTASSGQGGGIENHGTLLVRNSTISDNVAGSGGAAIYNGFGPNSGGASLSLNNVTISFNMVLTSGGGGDVTGGIYNEPASSVELSNSIVARNAINSIEAADCLGTITSRGYNLFSNLAGCTVGGGLSHDIVTPDPGLDSPSDLDPAGTVSYPLEPGSPALGAGNPAVPGSSAFACEPVDQQDVIRPQGLRCDMGAREMPADMEPPTDTPGPEPSPTDTGTPTETPTEVPPTATETPTAVPPTSTETHTPAPSVTPTTTIPRTPTITRTPTRTLIPSPTWTLTPTAGPSPTATSTRVTPTTLRVPGEIPTIQDAIRAAIDGDTILVAPGTYMERIDFLGKAISIVGEGGPEVTVIDGALLGTVVVFRSGEGPGSSLNGFTIRNGMASASSLAAAGIDVRGASPTVVHNVIEGNQGCEGVGIRIYGGSPLIENNLIRQNHTTTCSGGSGGSGILIASAGSARLIGNVIELNTTGSAFAAGVVLNSAGTPRLEGNIIRNNSGGQLGGGISIVNRSDAEIVQNLIVGNRAASGGGVYWTVPSGGRGPFLVNNTIVGNSAEQGSAVYAGGFDAAALVVNNLLIGLPGQAAVYCDSYDAFTPALRANDVFSSGGASYAGNCSDQTGLNGNLSADPLLSDPANGDYHLTLGSPAIDAGDNSAPGLSASDFEGDPRIMDGNRDGVDVVDMGYDEFESPYPPVPSPTPTAIPTPIPGSLLFDGFESGDFSAWSSAQVDQGDLTVSPGAALGGAYGLQADIDDNRSLYVVDASPTEETHYAARFYFDPNSIVMASGNSHLLFRALDSVSRTAFQIELRSYQGDYQIRAQAPLDNGGAYSTPWTRIHDDVHAIEAIWQAASADGANDGQLALWLDGDRIAGGEGLDNDTRYIDMVYLGAAAGIDTGTRDTYYFDSFGSTRGIAIGLDPGITLPSPPPTPDAVFADGFESGDLSAWSAITNGTDLIVNSSAALGGGFGLEAVVDDTAPRYVSDWSPVSLKAYAARFYFDPNSISMASGNSHVLLKAVDAASKTAFQLELRSYQGDYQIRAYAPWDSGGAYASPWFRLSDDPHLLELIWQAASADGASDGWLSLWIDAESAASGSGLDNDTRRVDKVDLGAVAGLDSGTSGTYYFDAFASTTGIPIGPDPGATLPTPPSPPDEIFADGFESGGLSGWSAPKNEGDLLVNNGSALAGGYGLEAIADDTAPRYVTDWSPVAEKEYHVRFAFDPNSLTMLDGRSHVIFQAISGTSKPIVRVELRYKSLNYELRSGLLTDAGQWVNSSWWYIDAAPQVIELEWRAASDPAMADGRLVMWINELQSEVRDGIANGSLSVDLARLGLVAGIDAGTLGSMSFDAFESRRTSHIGLPGE